MNPYFLFQIGSHHFFIKTHRLVEILQTYEVHTIPHSPPHILGFAALQGTIIVLVNMHQLLRIPLPTTENARLMIFEYQGEKVGIVVDFIDVAHSFSEIKSPTNHPLKTHILNSFEHSGFVAHLLNMESLLNSLG